MHRTPPRKPLSALAQKEPSASRSISVFENLLDVPAGIVWRISQIPLKNGWGRKRGGRRGVGGRRWLTVRIVVATCARMPTLCSGAPLS